MESFFGRYKNPLVLMAVLFIQIIALATQVKRPSDPRNPNSPGTRLIRVWAVTAFTPVEKAFVGTGRFFRNGWHNWADLRGVRQQNQDLQAEIARMRVEEIRLKEDGQQAHRLQSLFGFREKFIAETLAAQVIGTSGSEQSRVIYIDKGSRDGVRQDMAVVTPDGIVGKIKDVFPLSSQVLLISDRDSGAGVILEKSRRLQAVLKGTNLGEMRVDGVMADEKVESGDPIIASGGDRIYPKGFPVGTVLSAVPDRESGAFLTIKVKPAADLNRLEEVLVVTKMADQAPAVAANEGRVRAADILAQRLPTVPKTEQQPGAATPSGSAKKNPLATPELKKPKTNLASGDAAVPAKSKPNKTEGQESPPKTEQTTPQESPQPPAAAPTTDEPKPPSPAERPPQ